MHSVFKKHVSIRAALLYQVQIPMAFFKISLRFGNATIDVQDCIGKFVEHMRNVATLPAAVNEKLFSGYAV